MNARILLLVACVSCTTISLAQERLGLANSNYAGTTGMPLNPSSMVDSKAWLDINLVGVDAFAWNNFVYLSISTSSVMFLRGIFLRHFTE